MAIPEAEATVNRNGADILVGALMERSAWFEVFSLPDSNYRIKTRAEHVFLLRDVEKEHPPELPEEGDDDGKA